MTKYIVMAAFLIFATFGAYLYFFYFNSNQQFVIDSQKWSDFGGFIGGVLGPMLSALALIAVSETLKNQKIANEYSQKFDDIKMRVEDLENISNQFDKIISEPANKLKGKSIFDAINDCYFKRCDKTQEIEDCARVVVNTLISISNIVCVIEKKKKILFNDDFSALAFKQKWMYKYTGFGKCAYNLIDSNSFNDSQKGVLKSGLGIE